LTLTKNRTTKRNREKACRAEFIPVRDEQAKTSRKLRAPVLTDNTRRTAFSGRMALSQRFWFVKDIDKLEKTAPRLRRAMVLGRLSDLMQITCGTNSK